MLQDFLTVCGMLVFRRRSIRKLHEMDGGLIHYLVPVVLFLSALIISAPANHDWNAETTALDVLIFVLMECALFVFWILGVFSIAEPLYSLLLKISTADEVELHWWNRNRRTTRLAVFAVFSSFYLFYSIAQLFIITGSAFSLALAGFVILWGYFALTAVTRYIWNFRPFSASVVSLGPTVVIATLAVSLLTPVVAYLVGIPAMIVAMFFTTSDIRLDRQARSDAESIIRKGEIDIASFNDFLEKIHQGGHPAPAGMILEALAAGKIKDESSLPRWVKVRLLSTVGHYMEAIDEGLEAISGDLENVGLHLALAEASLGARDPENCAAHAEEALDLIGGGAVMIEGREALLFIALASFNQWEIESGQKACARILTFTKVKDGLRQRRIIKEARMLAQRFGMQEIEED